MKLSRTLLAVGAAITITPSVQAADSPSGPLQARAPKALLLAQARPVQRATLKRPGPSKHALVVILENGGIGNNLDPKLRQALNKNIRYAACGNWKFALRKNEKVPALVARVAKQLAGNATCLNPLKWQVKTLNGLQWVNQQSDKALEDAIKGTHALLKSQRRYDRVVILEDRNAVPARVIAEMRRLAPTHVLDVHVLTHGADERFIGYGNQRFDERSFFGVLRADQARGLPLTLRAVYQMNCVGGTLKNDWIRLGAKVVNGTRGKENNNMPHQYVHFLRRWLNNEPFGTASERSFQTAATYSRPIYGLVGLGKLVDVSRLIAQGQNLTVSTR
ncbi:MAG: hypothetical protein R3E48_14585 [Burkholderiaceae bacterium]